MPKNNFYTDKQQMENDKTTKETAVDKAKPRCSVCGKYTDMKTSPQCPGHGGGGGGGSGESSSSEETSKHDDNAPSKTPDPIDQSTSVATEHGADRSFNLQLQAADKPFNTEIISGLLSNRLLLIDNDRDLGTLTIKLLFNPKDLPTEQRNEFKKFIDTILKELEEFKKENGIPSSCKLLEQDKAGNTLSLRIALTSTLYDAFIQRLSSKNLLPVQNIEQKAKERIRYQEGINHFNPTPLSTKLAPHTHRKVEDEDIYKINKQGAPQAEKSIRPKSPLDGLKPKGWK